MPPEYVSESDYRALGLRPGAKPPQIKRAYRLLAKQWHPDRFHSQSYEARALAEEKFREINEAYERLIKNWWRGTGPAKPAESGSPEDVQADPQGSGQAGSREADPYAGGARGFDAVKDAWRYNRSRRRVGDLVSRFGKSRFAALFLFTLFGVATVFLVQFSDWTFQEDSRPLQPRTEERIAGPQAGPAKPRESEQTLDQLLSQVMPTPLPQPPKMQSPAEAPGAFFTIGSSTSEVLKVQGKPSRVQGQTWIYGLSEIVFRNGMVLRFNNFDGALRVRMLPRNPDARALPTFTIGSSQDDVLLVQGTPTRIEQDKWFYGFAEVRFKDGRVREYDNYFGALKVKVIPSPLAGFNPQTYYFTIGSTPDEVLAVQGTPTTIQGNVWSYDFSYVFFRDGKVSNVSDAEGKLRYLSPEDAPEGPKGGFMGAPSSKTGS